MALKVFADHLKSLVGKEVHVTFGENSGIVKGHLKDVGPDCLVIESEGKTVIVHTTHVSAVLEA